MRYGTPAGGIATVSVVTHEDATVLRIEDNGPGIPEHEREHVFERFYCTHEDRSDGWGFFGGAIVR